MSTLTQPSVCLHNTTLTFCIEVIGTWTELLGPHKKHTYLVVEMTNGLPYNLLTSPDITPFGLTYGEKDYYVDAIELLKYQLAWSNDMSVRPLDMCWDEF